MINSKNLPSIYIASKNQGKIREINEIVTSELDFHLASELSPNLTWQETGKTFAENALIKARQVRKFTSSPIIADDSGLVVDALGGEPGIYSSRYAGQEGNHRANIKKLLGELAAFPGVSREAHFICLVAYISPDGKEHLFEGICEGIIALEPKGKNGFGYDPVFLPKRLQKTMAEISSEEKNKISHRGKAITAWERFFLGELPISY